MKHILFLMRASPYRLFLSLAALLLLFPCTIFAQTTTKSTGGIAGVVHLTQNLLENTQIVSQEIIRSYSITTGNFGSENTGEFHTPPAIVVYLINDVVKNAKPTDGKPEYMVMDQKNERFVPHILPIQRGTAVRFLNSDSIYHNVFSLSPAKNFDLGRYPKGQYRAVTFSKPGVVKVYCDIHTHMNAYILVLDTPYFTVTDSSGHFSLAAVPAGEYSLVVWYGRWPQKSQKAVIVSGETRRFEVTFP